MQKISIVSRAVKTLVAIAGIINILVFVATSSVQEHTFGNDSATPTSDVTGVQSSLVFSLTRDLSTDQQFVLETSGPVGLFLATLAEAVLFSLLCWYLYRLFHQFQHGHIFTTKAIRYLQRLSLLLMLKPLIELIYGNLFLVGLRLLGIADSVALTIAIGSDDLTIITIGLMLTIVAWIMAEGARLHEEQELTI